MKIEFNLTHPNEETIRAFTQRMSRYYTVEPIHPTIKQAKENSITQNSITLSADAISETEDSKNFSILGGLTPEQHQLNFTIALEAANEFLIDDPQAKLRLFLDQEHVLLEREKLAKTLSDYRNNKKIFSQPSIKPVSKPKSLAA